MVMEFTYTEPSLVPPFSVMAASSLVSAGTFMGFVTSTYTPRSLFTHWPNHSWLAKSHGRSW